jgi:hypothetical protein
MPVLIVIHSYIYEVADYCSKHPGEGSVNNFLNNGHTNDPNELLIEAQNNNFQKTQSGISFVCPFFFKRRIPKYFHYINEDNLEDEITNIFSEKENNCFIVRRNINTNKKSLIITYFIKNDNMVRNKYIIKVKNYWHGYLYINNKVNGNKEKDVETLIDKMMKDFIPINS